MATRWCPFSPLGPGHDPGSTSSTLCPAEMAAAAARAVLFPAARRRLWGFTESFFVGCAAGRVSFLPLAWVQPVSGPVPARQAGVTGAWLSHWRRRRTSHPRVWPSRRGPAEHHAARDAQLPPALGWLRSPAARDVPVTCGMTLVTVPSPHSY